MLLRSLKIPKSLKKKKKIKQNLYSGSINLIIGTHAILSGDIQFNNLGLIIIDEEQSFGVEQRKVKQIKPNVHILTMSQPQFQNITIIFIKAQRYFAYKNSSVNEVKYKNLFDDY